MKKIMIINGPNLNFTGIREKEIYGNKSYKDLLRLLKETGKEKHIKLKTYQSQYEGKIILYIQKAYLNGYDGIILNAGAYTHYSYAIRDAIKSIPLDVVEVHLSNTLERDDFRKTNVIRDVCVKTFEGGHFNSYIDAINFLTTK